MNNYKINYPDNLPISKHINEIKDLFKQNNIIIVCGETGSGKTTQLPKLLLEMGLGDIGMIGHTQPRKVAARTISKRIGEELGNPDVVGYKVRFQDKSTLDTKIKLMTDGILLQEIQTDRLLKKYSALIIDEVHERSLNIDFILGYLKSIIKKRPDLKIIITSATIENEKISQFFYNAPVVFVEGKTYPVDIIYQEVGVDNDDLDLNDAIYKAIESCLEIERGNVLVFLPGEAEIKDCIYHLKHSLLKHCNILALFSRQNEQEQQKVFIDDGSLKIIITTNVAETSLTIPGIKYVIDSGLAKVKRYNPRYRVDQLLVEKVSQANLKQRAGRAGRVSHGMCIRLLSQDDFNQRTEFATPEILRSNLANVILKLLTLRLGDPMSFPFLDMPDKQAFADGYKTLYQLKAVNDEYYLTDVGRLLANIPIDCNLAKMLLESKKLNVLEDMLIIVAFLSISDPRQNPIEHKELSKQSHMQFMDKKSEFIGIINLWVWFNEQKASLKQKQLIQLCHKNFLSYTHLREWVELYILLKQVITHNKSDITLNYELIHRGLLSGLMNNIGQKDLVDDYYLGINGKKFHIHPTSYITKPKWILSSNLTQTSRLYARVNAEIDPKWLVPYVTHLVKYNHTNEQYDEKRGEVTTLQSTLFYGLTIEKKRVPLARVDPILAREVFIEQGIVLNKLNKNYSFIKHNQSVINKIENLEDKIRASIIIIEEELTKFYKNVIPLNIFDIRTFDVWLKDNEDSLKLSMESFSKVFDSIDETIKLYPDYLLFDKTRINLKYVFDHNHLADGVTANIALAHLNMVDENKFSWLVPGFIRDKIAFIIKQLPKNIRVQLNPINDTINKFLDSANAGNDFNTELVKYIKNTINVEIDPIVFYNIDYPTYLKFHFKVVDKNDVIYSDDIEELKNKLAKKLKSYISSAVDEHQVLDIKSWSSELDNLLEETTLNKNAQKIIGYKALVYVDKKINLTILTDKDKAKTATMNGLFHLVKTQLNEQIRYIESKKFKNFNNVLLYIKDHYTADLILNDFVFQVLRMSINLDNIPRNESDFITLVNQSRQSIIQNMVDLGDNLASCIALYHKIKLRVMKHDLKEIILEQLDNLMYEGFIKDTPYVYLLRYSTYFEAINKRVDKYANNPIRDRTLQDEVTNVYEAWYNYVDVMEENNHSLNREVYDFRFKIEELRVALFAQELKTLFPISTKRLFKELECFSGFTQVIKGLV